MDIICQSINQSCLLFNNTIFKSPFKFSLTYRSSNISATLLNSFEQHSRKQWNLKNWPQTSCKSIQMRNMAVMSSIWAHKRNYKKFNSESKICSKLKLLQTNFMWKSRHKRWHEKKPYVWKVCFAGNKTRFISLTSHEL